MTTKHDHYRLSEKQRAEIIASLMGRGDRTKVFVMLGSLPVIRDEPDDFSGWARAIV